MVLMMPQVGVDMREIGNDLTVDLIQSLRVAFTVYFIKSLYILLRPLTPEYLFHFLSNVYILSWRRGFMVFRFL